MSCVSGGYYSEKIRKAQKEHKCIECLEPISKDDKYADCRWGGGEYDFADVAKQHIHCWHVARCANHGTSEFDTPLQINERLQCFREDIGDGECVEFGGLREEFNMRRRDNDDYYDSIEKMWKDLIVGVKEKFNHGGGI